MKKKKSKVEFKTNVVPDDGTPNHVYIKTPDGTIEITGTSKFVSTVFRQMLEHPESLIVKELAEAYNALPKKEQKRVRKELKMGEYANPDDVIWPAWIEQ